MDLTGSFRKTAIQGKSFNFHFGGRSGCLGAVQVQDKEKCEGAAAASFSPATDLSLSLFPPPFSPPAQAAPFLPRLPWQPPGLPRSRVCCGIARQQQQQPPPPPAAGIAPAAAVFLVASHGAAGCRAQRRLRLGPRRIRRERGRRPPSWQVRDSKKWDEFARPRRGRPFRPSHHARRRPLLLAGAPTPAAAPFLLEAPEVQFVFGPG